MLKSISIKGLRGYSQEVILHPARPNGQPGSGLTLITGPNNSGKSTLVEAFRLRRSWRTPSFNVGVRNAKDNSVSIVFDFDNHKEVIRSISPGSSESTVEGQNLQMESTYFVPSRRYFSPAFSRGDQTNRSSFSGNYNSQTENRSPQISSFEGRLLAIEKDQVRFNSVMQKVIPDMLSWAIDQHETGQYFLKFFSTEKSHSSEGVGEGIISAFVIVASLFDSGPGEIIVIDEPELSLHPQIQRRLSGLFELYSADRQLIISTHSPYFVTRTAIEGGCAICRTWDRGDTIELHQISASPRGSALEKLSRPDFHNPHTFGLDAREVFFLEDSVLVLEGQEDVVLWPIVTREIGNSGYQVYGWGAGGSGKIPLVLEILQGLGFRKVAALYDSDKQIEMEAARKRFPQFFIDIIPAEDIRTKDPRAEQAGKVGILDRRYRLRPECEPQIKNLLDRLDSFIVQPPSAKPH